MSSQPTIKEQMLAFGRALSVKELAKLLNVSEDTITRYCDRGIIPGIKFGELRRFDPVALAKWYEESENKTGGQQ